MHSGRGKPRCGTRRGDAQGQRAAPRRSAPLGSPMERPAEPRPPSDPPRRTYPRRAPPAVAGLSAGRWDGGGLGPGMGSAPIGAPRGAAPARDKARASGAVEGGGLLWVVRRACPGVPEAKLFTSALGAKEHPEPRSHRLLPLLPVPRPSALLRAAGAPWPIAGPLPTGPRRGRTGNQGRAGLAVAPPGGPSPYHGALPTSKRTERRGVFPTGALQPARTVQSLCSDAGLTRF